MTTTTTARKVERIEVRATTKQEGLIRQAAEAAAVTVTDFILGASVREAQRVLADRRWFTGTAEEYERFLDLLDAPLETTDRFERLWSRPSPFGEPFSLAAT
jgi:uncharacterized protein (DUF1778 family)